MSKQPRVFIALDYPSVTMAEAFIARINPDQCGLKVGKALFLRAGPNFVASLVERGFQVFLDLKFHDIPNQVASAVKAAADLGVTYLTLHAMGGAAMLSAGLEAIASRESAPTLLAVTVLTSFNDAALAELGMHVSLLDLAKQLVTVSTQAGIKGFVCSAHEVSALKRLAKDACFVTPGIRLDDDHLDDQARVMTPLEACRAGADLLVIGRPITQAHDPWAVLQQINKMIEGEIP